MINLIKKQSPARIIALGYATLIFVGSILLSLPFSVQDGVELKYVDALYTSTSAVCVTGLISVDAGDTFTSIGQFILALLIQIGGLGVTTIGVGIIILIGKRVNIKGRVLIKESMNVGSSSGIVKLIIRIFITTVTIEFVGALLSFFVFVQDYPVIDAIGISLFHSIATFNNSGFDILGNYQSLIPYQNNILLNIVTCVLIFLGGIGFLVIRELLAKKFNWKKLSMHAKVVLSTSFVLIIVGAVLLKATENITWLGAFFHSISARTAGFSTFSLSDFTKSGLLVLIILMFIGASSGSTGGGIKTSTFFVLLQGIKSAATNKSEKAFRYSIPKEAFRKAAVVTILSLAVVVLNTYLMGIFEPNLDFIDILFEMTSAFGTVGLSTGITKDLTVASKILSMFMMYTGRLGPLTIATLWHFSKGERITYPEGNITIG